MRRVLGIAVILSGIAVGVIACTSASKTYGPSGQEAYSINCSGPRHSWDDCYQKAGKVCGARGYEIVERSRDSGTRVSLSDPSVYDFERVMLVECNSPEAALAPHRKFRHPEIDAEW